MSTESMISGSAPGALAARFSGQVIGPADSDYKTARLVWNALIDDRPAMIARPAGVDDVKRAVEFALEHGLDLAVRGGGHGVAGYGTCNDGLVLDLSSMKGIAVNEKDRTARVGPGVIWGEFDHATQELSLATTGGFVPTTGIAGLTLGGGLGYLMRRFGLACDNLLSAEVVTADGSLIRASVEENEDLFWGLRGGGGNFGVVTSFEFQLHEVGPTVLAGLIAHPLPKAADAIRFYREFTQSVPDELTLHAALAPAPDGTPICGFIVCYSGSPDRGEDVIRPLREFGPPVADMVQPMPYTAIQALGGDLYPPGRLNYWKSSFVRELSDEAIDTMVERFAKVPSPFSAAALEHMGGAVRTVGPDETAFGDRDVDYSLIITAQWTDLAEAEQNVRWTRDYWDAMQPFAKDTVYVNYLGAEGDERVRSSYGQHYERLVELKNTYDPTNLFHLNQNIVPTVG